MDDCYKLIILPEAQRDIRNTVLHIARELAAPQAALKLQEEFQKGINSLSEMPKRFKTVDEQPWKDAGVRRLIVKNYYVYYIADDESMTVKIIAVIYTRMNQENQMSDRKMESI